MGVRLSSLQLVLGLALGVLTANTAYAQAIRKCEQADGSIAYQDRPCAPGRELEPPVILPAPMFDAAPPPSAASAAAPSQRLAFESTWSPPPPPLPALYRCTKPDGSSYVSSDPNPAPVYVPAWVVGATTTTSNLRRTPAREAFDRQIGGAYVLVQDRCRPMPRAELCAYWKQRYDAVRAASGRTFFDERVANEQEAHGLRDQLATWCGR
jgi:hypothetical protein